MKVSIFFKGWSKYNPPLQIVFVCHPPLEIVFYPPLKTVFIVMYIQNYLFLKCNVSVPLYNLIILKINTPRALTIIYTYF